MDTAAQGSVSLNISGWAESSKREPFGELQQVFTGQVPFASPNQHHTQPTASKHLSKQFQQTFNKSTNYLLTIFWGTRFFVDFLSQKTFVWQAIFPVNINFEAS